MLDDDHWQAPAWRGPLHARLHMDFTRLPEDIRSWWRAVLGEAFRVDSVRQAGLIWATALWFTRFLAEHGRVTTEWDTFTLADWRAYAQWLTQQTGSHHRPLSHDYRRCQLIWLRTAATHAVILGLPGTSRVTIERLKEASRAASRGYAAAVRRRIARRALTDEQCTELYRMMAEEWQRCQDNIRAPIIDADLPALAALWLAFNDGVRSAEINRLIVEDVQPDPLYGKHYLRVQAPNKDADAIPIEKDTLQILQQLIEEGAPARRAIHTKQLFVTVRGMPRVLTTDSLTSRVRRMIQRHGAVLPPDLKLPDGRTTMGTHLAYALPNRERVRRVMRHTWARTTETYYRAHMKLVVAGHMARALLGETLRLTVALQQPLLDIRERPDQVDILRRNPENALLQWGSCGLDTERQGSCRMATHCFECPLLIPWVSKRHNYVYERDEYLRRAHETANARDRERLLYHANLAHAHILLIDRRLEREANGTRTDPERHRRPRHASRST